MSRRPVGSGKSQPVTAKPAVVVKARTVGHGGRTMTFRVWPLWVHVLRVALVLLAVVAFGIAAADFAGVDLIPDLPLPSLGGW